MWCIKYIYDVQPGSLMYKKKKKCYFMILMANNDKYTSVAVIFHDAPMYKKKMKN